MFQLLGLLPNGKHKIVFVDFGNTAEVDEILELPEPLVSIPCHLERFFMKGVKLVESDKIDNEIDRKVDMYTFSLLKFTFKWSFSKFKYLIAVIPVVQAAIELAGGHCDYKKHSGTRSDSQAW